MIFASTLPLPSCYDKEIRRITLVELSELLLSTNDQFLLALQNDRPIEVLQHLRDCLKEIHAEIKKREGLQRKRMISIATPCAAVDTY